MGNFGSHIFLQLLMTEQCNKPWYTMYKFVTFCLRKRNPGWHYWIFDHIPSQPSSHLDILMYLTSEEAGNIISFATCRLRTTLPLYEVA
jgi:hypothetical protein